MLRSLIKLRRMWGRLVTCLPAIGNRLYNSLAQDQADYQSAAGFQPALHVLLLLLAFCACGLAEPADWIYTARYVVTMDAQHSLIEDGAIAIRADRIVGVGKRADIQKQFQARQRLDRPDAIIM